MQKKNKKTIGMKTLITMLCLAFLSTTLATAKKNNIYNAQSRTNYSQVASQPQYRGGEEALQQFIDLNLLMPTQAVEGIVRARFEVDKMGYIKNTRIITNLSPDADAEALRLISSMPTWDAALDARGLPTEARVILPIAFKTKPQFEGGEPALQSYIDQQKKTITEAKAGMVLLIIEIDETGNVANAEVAKSLSPEADTEALRLIKAMPQWKPASLEGQPVSMYQMLSVSF